MRKKALIIHGAYGHPKENWFPWLKKELEKLDYQVAIPLFPTPEGQNIKNWLNKFQNLNYQLDKNTIIIAHSIAPAFVLHLLENHQAKAAFFVSGFVGLLGIEKFDQINKTFFKDFNWDQIKSNCPQFFLYHGNNDPYVPIEMSHDLASKLGVRTQVIKNGGHLSKSSGFTKFEQLLSDIKTL